MKVQRLIASTLFILIMLFGISSLSAQNQEKARELFRKGVRAESLSEKESYYIQALELWPVYPEAHNNLADVYEKQGDYRQAIREYNLAITFAPGFSVPWFGLGDTYFYLGKYGKAQDVYEKGLEIEPESELSLEKRRMTRAITTSIPFDFDSDKLPLQTVSRLKEIGWAFSTEELSTLSFEIHGHTDSKGSSEYNRRLSVQRAQRVKRFLLDEFNIPANRLIVKGHGENRPIALNDTPEGRAMNRRVEFQKARSQEIEEE
ncbi:OmpA family protein [bacterium]|nr:OmpA family protein [bacterium]MBU1613905.1 OmpA family protein [bacterium]